MVLLVYLGRRLAAVALTLVVAGCSLAVAVGGGLGGLLAPSHAVPVASSAVYGRIVVGRFWDRRRRVGAGDSETARSGIERCRHEPSPDLRRYRVLEAAPALPDFSGPVITGVPPSASGFTASFEFVAPSAGLAGIRFESPGLVAPSFPESGVAAERAEAGAHGHREAVRLMG